MPAAIHPGHCIEVVGCTWCKCGNTGLEMRAGGYGQERFREIARCEVVLETVLWC